ncbi:MazG-like family protein [Salinilacihabitans rarus]|uniref:MazG-like family protein n=1 Tax=Salinilacihabitans rarus TaxID=2961596 RepID=UPI0020C85921|nr:MazG-like family protein [Salinilacihabitans rarus]
MDEQDRVATFLETYDLDAAPENRVLDLVSEVGEVATEVNESTDYGASPDDVAVARDELGDALFSLLSVCEAVDVDASAALDEALAKYERRLSETGTAASGE